MVVPPEEPELTLVLYFDDPSELANESDEPGLMAPLDDPFDESDAESLALCFEANGFKLLSQPACAGEIAMSQTPSATDNLQIAFTVPIP